MGFWWTPRGLHQVNILMVVVSYRAMTVPLYWEMLDNKSGNSSCQQRNDLLKLCIDLIGAARIGVVIDDREFMGHRWLKYLKDKKIAFLMRLHASQHSSLRWSYTDSRRFRASSRQANYSTGMFSGRSGRPYMGQLAGRW